MTHSHGSSLQEVRSDGRVLSVSMSPTHTFSKTAEKSISLLKGFGVEGDTHMGRNVQHLSRVAKDPSQPNLRQVHLVHAELFEELSGMGYSISPGDMGENITTSGIRLLSLPAGTRLFIGASAVVELTVLRNPCYKLDDFRSGLMVAVTGRDREGKLIRKAGVMGVVVESGIVQPGDTIAVEVPPEPHHPLESV